uniref:IDS-1 n=1 Tax=Gentiana crassa subsp. rigescens TaxID=3097545 RepID=A0A2H4CCJ9_9GENT|nr:IDS-1 [Gentiana rigescens]
MSWWWKRSIQAQTLPEKTEPNGTVETAAGSYESVALVVGVTGIVGSSLAQVLKLPGTPGGPWKVYGIARRPCPGWLAKFGVEYIQCDVSNTEEAKTKLSPLNDVTHIFYVSWIGSEDCETNAVMFQNILDNVIPVAKNLKHISLQTGSKHYFGVFEEGSGVEPHDSPFTEDLPRLNVPNFYHDLEDILYEETSKHGLTWCVQRPALIFGFSPCSLMNIVSTLSIYATICKHEKKPLVYPGSKASWNCYVDGADADLAAEHHIWAAVDPKAKNQVFNCKNGDVFKWKHVWKLLADEFELEMVGYIEGNEQVSMAELMKDKDAVWDEIVKTHKLEATKLKEIAAFWFADIAFSCVDLVMSMTKSREYGFLGFRDSMKSFKSCIHKMRSYKFIP